VNRAERRRAERHLREFHVEAGGVLKTVILRAALAALTFVAGDPSDPLVRAFRPAVAEFHRDLSAHDCLTCRQSFGPDQLPIDYVMLLPAFATPKVTMLSAVCERCSDKYVSDTELFDAATAVMKAWMWPDLRVLDMAALAPESGRA
jgi:hypothetical protein